MTEKKVFAISGSPRKGYNTDRLLQSYLQGVRDISAEIETKTIYLYDYDFKGCRACMICKQKHGASYGRCGYPDGIQQLLQEVSYSDAIVFGSPVYFGEITAELRAFLERLLYPYTQFKRNAPRTIAPRAIYTDFIYTMNVSERQMQSAQYLQNFAVIEDRISKMFGCPIHHLYACDTYQYKNYDLYEADLWDVTHKQEMRDTQFPKDLQQAYQMGEKAARTILAQ